MALPYDSEEGRDVAGAITALMCGEAYAQSSRIASAWVRSRYEVNREPMLTSSACTAMQCRNPARSRAAGVIPGRAGILGHRAATRRKVRLQELTSDRAAPTGTSAS